MRSMAVVTCASLAMLPSAQRTSRDAASKLHAPCSGTAAANDVCAGNRVTSLVSSATAGPAFETVAV